VIGTSKGFFFGEVVIAQQIKTPTPLLNDTGESTSTSRFISGDVIEADTQDVAALGNSCRSHYQISLPVQLP